MKDLQDITSDDLSKMSVDELQNLKKKWFDEANKNESIYKLHLIGRSLGERLRVNYGPKFEYKVEDFVVYIDDYGNYMTVRKNGKLVCSTHNEKLYVKPVVDLFIEKYYQKAKDIFDGADYSSEVNKKEKLLNELSF